MPYFGATTLMDVLQHVQKSGSVPHSGLHLVSTLNNRKSRTATPSNANAPPDAPADESVPRALPPVAAQTTDTLANLRKLSYVDASLWIVARLADGLAHAHGRGIVHRDLKPANVLITDDGQPMLLDFNLAVAVGPDAGPTAHVGGTLPYMAPEHLLAFQNGRGEVDARSDLYSLGLILFELLTGRTAFAIPHGSFKAVLTEMIGQRNAACPAVRPLNPDVSPAVEAIVRKCVQPDPADRYQTAADLREDIERHLADLPLRHAANPSLRERVRKWARRNPHLSSSSAVAGGRGGPPDRGRRYPVRLAGERPLARSRPRTARVPRRSERRSRSALSNGSGPLRPRRELATVRIDRRPVRRADGCGLERAAGRAIPARPGPGTTPRRPGRTAVPVRPRDRRKGPPPTDAAERTKLATEALDLSRHAQAEAGSTLNRSTALQQAGCTPSAGTRRGPSRCSARPARRPRRRRGTATCSGRNWPRSASTPAPSNSSTARPGLDPESFPAWFVRGNCHHALGQNDRAAECYSVCIALRKSFPQAWHNRGLTRLNQGTIPDALADFDEALRLDPDAADGYLDRALARQWAGNAAGALADLNRSIELGNTRTRVLFVRALVRDQLGDAAGAKLDRAEGLKRVPEDELSWLSRAQARLPGDLTGASADIDEALRLNPVSLPGFQLKAHVLMEQGRNQEALDLLDRAVGIYTQHVPFRAGRGVLHARMGNRTLALRDAKEAVLQDTSPANLYQIAGIYALTSKTATEDRRESLHLLRTALNAGFGLEYVDADPELEPLRGSTEFRDIVAAAKSRAKERKVQ